MEKVETAGAVASSPNQCGCTTCVLEIAMPDQSGQVTALLTRLRRGDQRGAEQLIPLVMDELRRLARHYLRDERTGHTLQPTALVHEAYLKLAGYQNLNWESRSHFIGVAAS